MAAAARAERPQVGKVRALRGRMPANVWQNGVSDYHLAGNSRDTCKPHSKQVRTGSVGRPDRFRVGRSSLPMTAGLDRWPFDDKIRSIDWLTNFKHRNIKNRHIKIFNKREDGFCQPSFFFSRKKQGRA